jgi:glycosyltransferase involved in cell wall biosynthesis
MKVLLLNQCFFPDVVATAQHGWDLARRLSRDGHEVTAIASQSIYGKAGATMPPIETIEGITVRRVAASRFGRASLLARAVDFLGFYLRAALAAFALPRQDVVICFTTPPFISLVGILLGLFRGTKTVYWAMDLYPDVAIACKVLRGGSAGARTLEWVNRMCLRRSAHVVVLGRCMQELIESKGIPKERISLIRPWAEPGQPARRRGAPNRFRDEWGAQGKCVVMYSGNFGLGHDFETVVDGIEGLRGDERFLFVMAGGGNRKQWVLDSLRSRGIGNVIDLPYQPREALAELLAAADVQLVSLAAGMEGIMVPSKFFGVAAAGRPVVYVGSPSGEIARCIADSGCGRVVAPRDAAAFKNALEVLAASSEEIESLGRAAETAACGPWSADADLDRWSALVRALA